jgi:hypothetical protein
MGISSQLMKNKTITSELISTEYKQQEGTDENILNTLPECENDVQIT